MALTLGWRLVVILHLSVETTVFALPFFGYCLLFDGLYRILERNLSAAAKAATGHIIIRLEVH